MAVRTAEGPEEAGGPNPALAGVPSARKCPGTGFVGQWDQPERRREGLAFFATRPEKGGGWQAGSEGRSPAPQPCDTHPLPCASQVTLRRGSWGSLLRPSGSALTPSLWRGPGHAPCFHRKDCLRGHAPSVATLGVAWVLVLPAPGFLRTRGTSMRSPNSYAARRHSTTTPASSQFALRRCGLHGPLRGGQARWQVYPGPPAPCFGSAGP